MSGIYTIDRKSPRDIDTFVTAQFERVLLIIRVLIYLNLFISVDNPSRRAYSSPQYYVSLAIVYPLLKNALHSPL